MVNMVSLKQLLLDQILNGCQFWRCLKNNNVGLTSINCMSNNITISFEKKICSCFIARKNRRKKLITTNYSYFNTNNSWPHCCTWSQNQTQLTQHINIINLICFFLKRLTNLSLTWRNFLFTISTIQALF